MSVENNICDAIAIMVNQAVENAQYNKTLEGKIIACIDADHQKYRVLYQDSFFYAYNLDKKTSYNINDIVYISIFNNNLDSTKIIIGKKENLYIDYTIKEDYIINNINCFLPIEEYGVSSFLNNEYVIYDESLNQDKDKILTNENIKNMFQNNNYLFIQASIKTDLPIQHQTEGNYGIEIKYKTREGLIKSLVFDTSLMSGNPFLYQNDTIQFNFFVLNGVNFEKIIKISLFAKDFPTIENNLNENNNIFIKNLEIKAAKKEIQNGGGSSGEEIY